MRLVRTGLLAALLVAVCAPAAGAQQYQHGAGYAEWSINGRTFTKYTQNIRPTTTAPETFYNMQWVIASGPVGYLGIQTRPVAVNVVHLSMFDATQFSAGATTTCTRFTEGSGGVQCQLPIADPTNKSVTLELAKDSPSDSTNTWWRAHATIDGVRRLVAAIRSPRAGKLYDFVNFQEYFGLGTGWNSTLGECVPPGPPPSEAVYGRPTITDPTFGSVALSWTRGSLHSCPGLAGSSTRSGTAAVIKLGDV